MEDNANDVTIQAAISAEELKQQMLQLKRLRAQIEDSIQEKPAEITRKIHKPNEQPVLCLQFDLEFDESL